MAKGIYQRGNNWYIDFTFKGRRIRESIGPSRKDAEKVIAKKKTEIVENKYLDIRKEPEPIKFHEFAKEYLKWSIENKKPSSKTREMSNMRTLDRTFGDKYIHEIDSLQIERWKMNRKREVKLSTVNRELTVLKSFFSKAVKWAKCKQHPVKEVKPFKGVTGRLRYLMPDEVQRLISNCADHIKPIVTVAVHTGMRKGEVLGLRRDQVNFDQGTITLTDTKNSERRDIPMNETVKSILKAIRGDEPYFFTSSIRKGKPYRWIEMSFHEALKKSEIEDFHFHDLRHTFASNLVMAGEDLNTVAELLGHKGLEMTRRYAHLSPKFKKRAVYILDSLMSQNPPQEEKQERKVLELKR
jgi:integrase